MIKKVYIRSDSIKINKPKTNNNQKKSTLKEKIKKYKGPNLAKNFSWDDPKGKEKL